MIVKTLKAKLAEMPDHMEVMIGQLNSEFEFAPVETVGIEDIPLSEDPGGKKMAMEKVVVLRDLV